MLSGIINGCTNFMLTKMDQGGLSYEDSLAEASRLGYAEADPTLDVGGFDARSKLRILMRLAFGVEVDEDEISCRGITDLTKLDFEYAKMMGGTIKLIGVAKKVKENRVAAFVAPCYVTSDDTVRMITGLNGFVELGGFLIACLLTRLLHPHTACVSQRSHQCRRSHLIKFDFFHLYWTRCWSIPHCQLLCERHCRPCQGRHDTSPLQPPSKGHYFCQQL